MSAYQKLVKLGEVRRLTSYQRSGISYSRKMNVETVREARELYSRGLSMRKIAKRFDISNSAMQKICQHKTWKWVKA